MESGIGNPKDQYAVADVAGSRIDGYVPRELVNFSGTSYRMMAK